MIRYSILVSFLLLYNIAFLDASKINNKEDHIYFSEWIDKMSDFEKMHDILSSIIIEHPKDTIKNYKILSSIGILIDIQNFYDVDIAYIYKDNTLDLAIFELYGKGLSMNCDCEDYFNKHLSHAFSEKKRKRVKDYFYHRFQDYYDVGRKNRYIDHLMNEYEESLDADH